jgi:hypothetical protein
MDTFFIILTASIILTATLFLALLRRHKKLIKTKERGIVSLIHEQDQLKNELHYVNVEKKVMEKMLKEKIEAMVVFKIE